MLRLHDLCNLLMPHNKLLLNLINSDDFNFQFKKLIRFQKLSELDIYGSRKKQVTA